MEISGASFRRKPQRFLFSIIRPPSLQYNEGKRFPDGLNVIFRYSNADFSVVFPSFLDILMYFLGYSFTTLWVFFHNSLDILSQLPGYSFVVSRSLGQLYISSFRHLISIRIVFDWYSIVVRLVFDCRSARVRLLFN